MESRVDTAGSDRSRTERPKTGKLYKDHPELYGALLAVNERLDRAGAGVAWFMAALWAFAVIGIMGEWVRRIFGSSIHNLQSIWVYVLLAFVAWITCSRLQAWRRRRAYVRGREAIELEMARAGLKPNQLIATINDKDELKLVAAEIKGDEDFDTRRR